MRYTVVIPVLNGGEALQTLTDTLLEQTVPPEEIVIVDSASEDGAAQKAAGKERVRLIGIERKAFDHGGTRDMALRTCGTPFVVMMTQDALPTDRQCMERLLEPFRDPRVAAVCARQTAYPGAKAAEKAVRAFRYAEESDVWGKEDAARRGIRAWLLSDVCAAYRVSAYEQAGGFTHPLETNEDMLMAADLLDAGFRLAYRGDAAVYHSHEFTLRQEYERNRKIGQFLAQYGDRFRGGSVGGEGLRLVRTVSAGLLKKGKIGELIAFWGNCVARILGNRAGKRKRA